ncbi:hypothetical protein KZO60_01380 [Prevotella nanceiensis]|uniref:hypothetical protein n=1 Tax=Hoylesella nanceiensis TaxID=425941 RepID=UPI001C5D4CF4|nr:hypothetical protein [Hoylesella nanceiensis]MBW4766381.1 hypothetical protein [Hoylesella nanceiensis]
MRSLNKEEQQFCNRILQGNGNNNYIGNIIDDKLDNVRIVMNRQNSDVEILVTVSNQSPTAEDYNYAIKRYTEVFELILEVVNLIQLLEKEHYIMTIRRANQVQSPMSMGRGCVTLPCIGWKIPDSNIANLLIGYCEKEIYVTEEFRLFCNRRFIARDEQRFQKQIKLTCGALIISILALLFNLVSMFILKS